MSPSASLGAAAVACIPIYYSRTGTERDRDGLTISMGQCKSVHALQDGDALRSAPERGGTTWASDMVRSIGNDMLRSAHTRALWTYSTLYIVRLLHV